jgi:polysaccharide biosynthesis/export protein
MIAKALLLILTLVSAAQTAPPPPAVAPAPPEREARPEAAAQPPPSALASPPAGETDDYRVGFGDVLQITVFGDDDISRVAEVQPNGAVAIRYIGEIPVAGTTVAQIQEDLRRRLGENLLVNPQVEVKVREYRSQFVFVQGEVNNPGRKPLRGNTRLIDALLEAGGFTPRASYELRITRSQGGFEDGTSTITLRLSGAQTQADQISLQLPLHNGDIISASPKYFVTVDGEVNHPGRYAIESDLTVTGAVSLAGGLTRFGSNTVKVRRSDPQTSRVSVFEVDLKEVRNGKQPDPPLLPNDVISVGKRVF